MYFKSFILFFGILLEIIFAQNSENCGKPQVGIGNIIGGSHVHTRGAFPWAAVILNSNGNLRCGGTLVSSRKVISSAECIQPKKYINPRKPEEFTVILGLYDFDDYHESGRETVNVQEIIVHDDWRPYTKSYDADISILVLAEVIQFSTYIQPICLSTSSPVVAITQGVVVGYGRSEDRSIKQVQRLKMAKIAIHSNYECFQKFPHLAQYSSERTFCGGSSDGGGVCVGDNGNGFFVLHKGLYYLSGIVSSSILSANLGCDVETFAVYTNLIYYVDWIKRIEPAYGIEQQNNFFKAPAPALKYLIDTEDCGKPQVGRGNIVGGETILPNSFPWIAALMKNRTKFFCGGTLVSDQKVVTAAHCIQNKNSDVELLPREVTVLLGMHELNNYHSSGRRSIPVYKMYTHKYWNPYSKRFNSDIAVVVLDDKISFDRYIQPICLITPKSQVASITDGFVVGYGKSEVESEHENVPKWVHTPIQNDKDCLIRFPTLAQISSETTICGGTGSGTGVCNGDSGSGLFVTDGKVYYLRAIVSSSLISAKRLGCDVDAYSLYTDVLQFNEWIIKITP